MFKLNQTKRVMACVMLASALAASRAAPAAKAPVKEPLIPSYLEDSGIFTYTAVDEEKSSAADCDAANNLLGTSTAYANAWGNVYCWTETAIFNAKTKTANRITPTGVLESLSAKGGALYSTVFGEDGAQCVYQLTVDAGSVLGVKGKAKLDEVAVLTVKGEASAEPTPATLGCPNPGNYFAYARSGKKAFINNLPVTVDPVEKTATLPYVEGTTQLAKAEEEGYLTWAWMPAEAADATCTDPIRVQDGICLGVKPPKAKVPKALRF
jgi:hypothetical protein